MNKFIALSLVTALLSSTTVLAKDEHQVGAQLFAGDASYKSSKKDGDGVSSLYLYYNYQFDSMFSLEAGFNVGAEIDDWDCKDVTSKKFECIREDNALFDINANKLEFTNFVVATKVQYDLTQNSDLYGKIGAHRYNYEMKNGDKQLVDEDGFGFLAEAGWAYEWSNGIGMNVAVRYLDMGDLDTTSLGAGITYRF